MEYSTLDPQMRQCIDHCLHCYRVCRETALNHCLETGDRHIETRHVRLMLDCAQICDTAASFMMGNSELHAKVCAVCADVCEACAQSCQEIGGMDACVQACQQCAEVCEQMAGARPGRERTRQRVAAPM